MGAKKTCFINCQGVRQPYLSRYNPARDEVIVLDEPSAELVSACKVFLQAGMDGCELYQSTTQRYTRWYCVHQVPIIICTNDWEGASMDIGEKLKTWIEQNSFHYPVTDYMYEE